MAAHGFAATMSHLGAIRGTTCRYRSHQPLSRLSKAPACLKHRKTDRKHKQHHDDHQRLLKIRHISKGDKEDDCIGAG